MLLREKGNLIFGVQLQPIIGAEVAGGQGRKSAGEFRARIQGWQ
jgi:hypothetical protein